MTQNETNDFDDTQTVIITRHVERLRNLVQRYHDWFETDNHAEATAMVMADCYLLLADLDTDPDEVRRFVDAVNLRRLVPGRGHDEVPGIVCRVTLDEMAKGD